MDEMNNNVYEEVVIPQNEENFDTSQEVETMDQSENVEVAESGNNEEVAETQINKPIQSTEDNARFAKIRREAEQRARDSVISEMGMEWNGQPITNYQQYQQALREKSLIEEAQQQGLDPQFYTDFRNMQDELNYYKRSTAINQQDVELANDPVRGNIYNQWKDDIKQIAIACNVDLKTAFSVVLEERLNEVLEVNSKRIQQDTISKINSNQTTTPGSLGASNDQPSLNAWDMSNDDFEKMLKKATSGALRRY